MEDELKLCIMMGKVAYRVAHRTLSMSEQSKDPIQRFMSDLCDHIVAEHHTFVRREGPEILAQSRQLVVKDLASFKQIQRDFEALFHALEPHMCKEETVIFPVCKRLEAEGPLFDSPLGSANNAVRIVFHEHTQGYDALHALEKQLQQPHAEGPEFSEWLHRIQRFCDDLKLHIYLENEVLFSMAMFRENVLKAKAAAKAKGSPKA